MPRSVAYLAAVACIMSFAAGCHAALGEWTYWTAYGTARYQALSWTDPTNNRVYIYGGYNGVNLHDFLYASVSGSVSWTTISSGYGLQGVYPANAGDPAAADLHPGHRMFSATAVQKTDYGTILWLFGGSAYGEAGSATGPMNDVWYYNTTSGLWRFMAGSKTFSTPSTGPSPRYVTHAWFFANSRLFIIAGGEDSSFSPLPMDVWAFNTNTMSWFSFQQLGSSRPGGRNHGSTFIDGTTLYMFGGYNGTSGNSGDYINELWAFQMNTSSWEAVRIPASISGALTTQNNVFSASNDPIARWKCTLAQGDGSRIAYLMGGVGAGVMNSLWAFSTVLKQWTQVTQFSTTSTITNQGVASSTTVPATVFGANGAVFNGQFYTFFGDQGAFSGLDLTYSYEIPCSAGFFKNPTTGHCTACPGGSENNVNNNDASFCTQCNAGQYSNSSTGFVCTNCADGYGAAAAGSASCTICPAGMLSNGGTSFICMNCSGGTSSNAGATGCFTCTAGTYSNPSTAFLCLPCADGEGTPSEGYSLCDVCSAGQYSNSSTGRNCTYCPAGYGSAIRSAECSICPAGQYSNSSTSFVCTNCPSGFTSEAGASACFEQPPVSPPQQPPVDPPQQSPISPPQQSPISPPQQSPISPPQQPPVNAPVNSPQQAPVNSPQQAPQQPPMNAPQQAPQQSPQQAPQSVPVAVPQASPFASPVATPQAVPVAAPMAAPVAVPQASPTASPVAAPAASAASPQATPSQSPSLTPSLAPATSPVAIPAVAPVDSPSLSPSSAPSSAPMASNPPNNVQAPANAPMAPVPSSAPILPPFAAPIFSPDSAASAPSQAISPIADSAPIAVTPTPSSSNPTVVCRLLGSFAPNQTVIDAICQAVRTSLALTSDVSCFLRSQKRASLATFTVAGEMTSTTSANAAYRASQSTTELQSLNSSIIAAVTATSDLVVQSVEIVIPSNFPRPPVAAPPSTVPLAEPSTDSGIVSGSSQLPAIIGGAVGGGVALILIIVIIAVVVTRKKKPTQSETPLPAVIPATRPTSPSAAAPMQKAVDEDSQDEESSEAESSYESEEDSEEDEESEENSAEESGEVSEDEESEQEDSEEESEQDESDENESSEAGESSGAQDESNEDDASNDDEDADDSDDGSSDSGSASGSSEESS